MAPVFDGLIEKFGKKKDLKHGCKYIFESLYFDGDNKVRLCPYSDTGIIEERYDGLWLDIDKITEERNRIASEFNNNSEQCNGCPNLKQESTELKTPLKYLYLSNWKNCFLNCIYCDRKKEEDLIKAKHYDIMPTIQQLIDKKLVTTDTTVIFDCGDPCIHPEFDKILFFFINYEMKNIIINTPALRYCESVATAIAKNIAEVVISFDSGCPYIYEKIKGHNKFDIAVNNINRYLVVQEPKEKRVILKYTIMNGINDNQKEILDWYIFARDMGIRKLVLDVDLKWYNQIKASIPKYLKDLIIFSKNISKFNTMEIIFSEAANAIYKETQK